jgi:hypothetical protein
MFDLAFFRQIYYIEFAFFRQIYYIEFERWNFLETYRNLALKMRSCTSGRPEQLELSFYEYANKNNTEQIGVLGHYVYMKRIYFSVQIVSTSF